MLKDVADSKRINTHIQDRRIKRQEEKKAQAEQDQENKEEEEEEEQVRRGVFFLEFSIWELDLINIMPADDLATQRARTSADMILMVLWGRVLFFWGTFY